MDLATINDQEKSVAMMSKIGASWSPTFSSDGERIAFISTLNGSPQVWTVPSEGGWPELVTTLDDPVGTVRWSPTGEWLAFSVAPGGGMNTQIYLVRPDGTGLHCLTENGTTNNWLGTWTDDGKALTIASNIKYPAVMDAYLVDVATHKHNLLSKNKGIGFLTDIHQQTNKAILYRMESRGNNDLYLVNLMNSKEVNLTPHYGDGSFYGKFSKDGDVVYLSSDKDRDKTVFARIKIDAGGQPGTIEIIAERKDAELEAFEINKQGTVAALIWNVAGRSELSLFDLILLKEKRGPALPSEIVHGLSFAPDGKLLAIVLSGAVTPKNIWTLNIKNNQFRQITSSPHAGVDLRKMISPELVHFTAHDNLELSGWLYRPLGFSSAGAVVISFHGGPEEQSRPFFDSLYQALLSQGIAVFAPNVRGSSGFGKTFASLDNGNLRINAIKDIKACVNYVVKAGIAAPEKIGIMGASYGGYMVMAGLTESPELFAAGANFFGISNLETFFAKTEPWIASTSKSEYGDPVADSVLIKQLSPINRIDRLVAPIIVLHGANDTNVPVAESEQIVRNLRKRSIPVEYVLFPDEGHGFTKTSNGITAYVSVVQWFNKYLRGQ